MDIQTPCSLPCGVKVLGNCRFEMDSISDCCFPVVLHIHTVNFAFFFFSRNTQLDMWFDVNNHWKIEWLIDAYCSPVLYKHNFKHINPVGQIKTAAFLLAILCAKYIRLSVNRACMPRLVYLSYSGLCICFCIVFACILLRTYQCDNLAYCAEESFTCISSHPDTYSPR